MNGKAKLYFDELWNWAWVDKKATGTLGEKHSELEAKYGKDARLESEEYVSSCFNAKGRELIHGNPNSGNSSLPNA